MAEAEVEEKINLTDIVAQYKMCRAESRRIDEEAKIAAAPYKEAMVTLENYLGALLHDMGCDNFKTSEGTVYKSPVTSVKIIDKELFHAYAINNNTDLLQISANKTALKELKDKKLPYPPGIEVTELININVRAK